MAHSDCIAALTVAPRGEDYGDGDRVWESTESPSGPKRPG